MDTLERLKQKLEARLQEAKAEKRHWESIDGINSPQRNFSSGEASAFASIIAAIEVLKSESVEQQTDKPGASEDFIICGA